MVRGRNATNTNTMPAPAKPRVNHDIFRLRRICVISQNFNCFFFLLFAQLNWCVWARALPFACIAAIYRNFLRFSFIYGSLCSNPTASKASALVRRLVRSIKMIRKLFQWLSKREFIKWICFAGIFALFAAEHSFYASKWYIQYVCRRQIEAIFLIKTLHTKITKYNHYKRIIHLKLRDLYRHTYLGVLFCILQLEEIRVRHET